jgi:hypothetical protein
MRVICLTALIALVVEFGIGMVLNLYKTIPSPGAHAGYEPEAGTGPVTLTVHTSLGVVLICAAIALLMRARSEGNRTLIRLAATGLIAMLGAFAAGEIFVRDGQMGASLCMAVLTAVALVSYIAVLNLVRVVPRQPAPLREPASRQPAPPRPPDLTMLPGQRPSPSGPPPWIRPGFAATGQHPSSAPVPADVGNPPWGDRAGAPPKLPIRKPFTGDFPKVGK